MTWQGRQIGWLERQGLEGFIHRGRTSQRQAFDVAAAVANDDALKDVINLVQRHVDVDLGIPVDGGRRTISAKPPVDRVTDLTGPFTPAKAVEVVRERKTTKIVAFETDINSPHKFT